MPTQPFHIAEMQHDKPLNEQVEYLTNELAKTQKILRYLLNGQIDFENIQARGIKAENIEAGAITTNELAAGSVTTDILAAGAVTAENIDVDMLSAISANLGEITSGKITGAIMQTSEPGMYPRMEFSSTDRMLKAESGLNQAIEYVASFTGSPAMIYVDGSDVSLIWSPNGMPFSIVAVSKDLFLSSNSHVRLSGTLVQVPGWSQLYGLSNGQTLQSALDSKANAFIGINMILRLKWVDDYPVDLTFNNGILVDVAAV